MFINHQCKHLNFEILFRVRYVYICGQNPSIMSISTDSEDEDLCSIKEATDDSFLNDFKANNCRGNNLDTGTHNLFPKDREKSHHYLRPVRDEKEQYKMFEVTPQFQSYVSKALTNKLNESFVERLMEYPKEKRRKGKNKDCIKLLNSSVCPIDMNNYEKDNILNDFSTYQHNSNSKKLKLTNCDQDLNVINSVVVSGIPKNEFIEAVKFT
ncbi:hypothetical protein WA026_002539 [Henosepilachna vigintioctopunctata]|uniref:Uncharacterized protein n=1 Tax=Henosepilachna vigintioctopunctata TaxID=420089 RepID=A0AAW1U2P4_9CUCU